MNIADLKKSSEVKMVKSVESLKADLAKIRTGRAHAGILDHIQVDYYGAMMPVSQLANITLADARTITVQPFEKKLISTIEKAIRDADLGLNPSTNGNVIRVPTPMLTEDRRRDLTKIVKSEGEDAKVAIRNVRRDANTQLKDALKTKTISEDEEKKAQDEVQKMTDKHIAQMDALVMAKERELLVV